MWVFLFSFQTYQLSVFVSSVKASFMFNKANDLVYSIHGEPSEQMSQTAFTSHI